MPCIYTFLSECFFFFQKEEKEEWLEFIVEELNLELNYPELLEVNQNVWQTVSLLMLSVAWYGFLSTCFCSCSGYWWTNRIEVGVIIKPILYIFLYSTTCYIAINYNPNVVLCVWIFFQAGLVRLLGFMGCTEDFVQWNYIYNWKGAGTTHINRICRDILTFSLT